MILRWLTLVLFMTLFFVVILFSVNQKSRLGEFVEEKPDLPQRNVYLGAWVTGFWDNDSKTLNTSTLSSFEEAIDHKMAIATIYSEWAYLSDNNLIMQLNEISEKGWVPMISANPYFFEKCPYQEKSLYQTIADGSCDTFLADVSNNLKSYNRPIFFRFAWEMNLPDMYWSIDQTSSSPDEFIAAWRHFHNTMNQHGADNVIWVLSFNTSNSNTTPYADLYPGDQYVDWVAIDGYNWGNTHPWSGWANFEGVFRDSYSEATSLTDKPVMLSEVNSAPTGTGGDKSRWLHDMLAVQIPHHFPKINAIVFFNEDKTEGEKVDWRMEQSPQYLYVLSKELDRDLYKSDYP